MRLEVRDLRVRVVLLLILVLLVGALTGHAVGMADHGMGMVVGGCLAVLGVIGLLAMPPFALDPAPAVGIRLTPTGRVGRVAERSSRPPPKDGTILRS